MSVSNEFQSRVSAGTGPRLRTHGVQPMQQEKAPFSVVMLTENGILLVEVLPSNFKFERLYVSNACLFKGCISMCRKPHLLSCLISRICSCSQACC